VPLQRRVRGTLAVEALRRAFEEVVRRHESLRTVYPARGGEPVQVVRAPARWEMPVDDVSAEPAATREHRVDELARAELERPFDLETGPVLRPRVVRVAPGDHLIPVTLPHLVSDAWAMTSFWN